MENDLGFGMSKKYGCVKKGMLKGFVDQACTISFINEGGVFFMIVDSKKETIKINCS